jgi:hypothetical protein
MVDMVRCSKDHIMSFESLAFGFQALGETIKISKRET